MSSSLLIFSAVEQGHEKHLLREDLDQSNSCPPKNRQQIGLVPRDYQLSSLRTPNTGHTLRNAWRSEKQSVSSSCRGDMLKTSVRISIISSENIFKHNFPAHFIWLQRWCHWPDELFWELHSTWSIDSCGKAQADSSSQAFGACQHIDWQIVSCQRGVLLVMKGRPDAKLWSVMPPAHFEPF